MSIIINLAEEIVQLKNDGLMSSDAFQLACREFCKQEKSIGPENEDLIKALNLFDNDIKKYIIAMTANLSWADFKNKNKDELKF